MATGAGLISYFPSDTPGNPFILIAKEGGYLVDSVKDVAFGAGPQRSVKEDLQIAPETPKNDSGFRFAKTKFEDRAKRISAALNYPADPAKKVHYTQPTWNAEKERFVTIYSCVTQNSRWGFVKGGLKPEDEGNTRKTVRREFSEETGVQVKGDDDKLIKIGDNNGYDWYIHKAKPEDADIINAKFQERMARHYSELFQLQFIKLSDVKHQLRPIMNARSKQALILFETYLAANPGLVGGVRNKRKSYKKHRKTRKRQSLRRK